MRCCIRCLIFISLFFQACRLQKQVGNERLASENKPNPAIPFYILQNENDLDILVREIGSARIVLLGEASHGTAEFQEWRAKISGRLIREKGFRLVAVEGDWNEFLTVNEFITATQDTGNVKSVLQQFKRWPTWLWATEEFGSFITSIKELNQSKKNNEKVRIFGFDLYGICESLDALRRNMPDSVSASALKNMENCFRPYSNNALAYSTVVHKKLTNCHLEAEKLKEVNRNLLNRKPMSEKDMILQQHLQTVIHGEQYFRIIVSNQALSWNTRDQHMDETIQRLLSFYGRDSKIIIWAHNSHVGDAAFTDMPQRGRTNLGELLRRKYGEQNVFIVGFGMYTGEVIAAYKWDSAEHVFQLPPAYKGSWEEYLHSIGEGNKIILSNEMRKVIALNHWYDQRGIGVLYHPERPRSSYVPSFVSRRYDAFIFIDTSHALKPLNPERNLP